VNSNWLAALPLGWQSARLKAVADLRKSRVSDSLTEANYVGLESIESWTGRLLKVDPLSLPPGDNGEGGVTVSQFLPGDVLFGKLRPYLAKAFLAQEAGLCTTELLVIKPGEKLDERFLLNIVLTQEFIGQANAATFGTRMPRADWDTIANILIPIPPLNQQRAIADYLDRETARLDELIAAKQRLLELLAEKRSALITHAVTRGLNPSAPLRDSGVPWLGEIPAHWEVEVARRLFTEIDQRSVAGEEELLTVSHLTGVTSRAEKDVNMFRAESLEGYKVCMPGDLVINTLWAWMGAMGVTFQHGIVSPAYNVYRPASYDPKYLDFLVRIPVFATEVTRFSKGVWSSRLRLYPEDFFEVLMPVPPLEEQQEIADYLGQAISKLDLLASSAQETIDLLQERRSALIAAAVTGQIDVTKQRCN
jgi:type I restriction enzyme, S subunit